MQAHVGPVARWVFAEPTVLELSTELLVGHAVSNAVVLSPRFVGHEQIKLTDTHTRLLLDVANGSRQLTAAHIRKLAGHFSLPADYFLES